MSLPFSVSKTMLRTSSMHMKFSTKILQDDSFNKRFRLYVQEVDFDNRKYIVIDNSSSITISYIDENHKKSDTAYIILHERNLYYFLVNVKDLYRDMKTKNIYYLDEDKKLSIYRLEDRFIKRIMINNTPIMIYPSISEDIDGTRYEALCISIISPVNTIYLRVEEIEAFLSVLSNVDFFLYSEALLHHFLAIYNRIDMLESAIPSYIPKNIFAQGDMLKDIEMVDKNRGYVEPEGSDDIESLSNLGGG